MFREVLGDYESKGTVIQGIGRFIALGLDDPFHITTITGFTVYGIGKYIEKKRTNYGIRMARMDIQNISRGIKELALDLSTLRF